jgi:hypothetical protein
MMAMGGSLIGILWGRLLFSLVVIFLLVRMMGWSEKNVKHERNGHS